MQYHQQFSSQLSLVPFCVFLNPTQTQSMILITFEIHLSMQGKTFERLLGKRVKTYDFVAEAGEGMWSKVYEAYDTNENKSVAIKAIPKSVLRENSKLLELVGTEIRVMRECDNQNVVKFITNLTTNNSILIVMEYCNGGDLEQYLQENGKLSEEEATTFLKHMLNGFKGLHKVHAMHRDFKAANVMLHDGVCKISDLGFSKQLKQKDLTTTILGTSLTMAPEVQLHQPYNFKADIWSVGVVFYQMLYGCYPYMGKDDKQIIANFKKGLPDFTKVNISTAAKDFILRCLTVNPEKRISWLQIYEHPLINQENRQKYMKVSSLQNNDMKDNMEFYRRGQLVQIKKQVDIPKMWNKTPESVEELSKIDRIRQMNEAKKKLSGLYHARRNNIMFIFKFVTPYIHSFYHLKINHDITLFILSKRAYIEMLQFNKKLIEKVNIFNQQKYFNEFVNSLVYEDIKKKAKIDQQQIFEQALVFQDEITNCSPQIRKQFDIEKVSSSKWLMLVQEIATSYEYLLIESYVNQQHFSIEVKENLVRVIEAINYYHNNMENIRDEFFSEYMRRLNFGEAESRIETRFHNIMEGYV